MRTPCTESACSWAISTAQIRLGTRGKTTTEAGQDAAFMRGVLRSLLVGRQCRASETLVKLSMSSLPISVVRCPLASAVTRASIL